VVPSLFIFFVGMLFDEFVLIMCWVNMLK